MTIASGKLVDLNFSYISGSGTFTFNTHNANNDGHRINFEWRHLYERSHHKQHSHNTHAWDCRGTCSRWYSECTYYRSKSDKCRSITLKIAYNTAVVTFMGVANAPTGVSSRAMRRAALFTLICMMHGQYILSPLQVGNLLTSALPI